LACACSTARRLARHSTRSRPPWWQETQVPPSTSNGALKRAASPSAHRTRGPFGLADSAPASGRARTGRAIRNPSGCRVGDAPGHRDKAHPVRHQHL
jgi:hypothetical protein